MNPEVFAEWFRRQGHTVVRTDSSYWYDAAPHVYQAFPFHWRIRPSDAELRSVLTGHRGIALRYSAPARDGEGRMSYHVVCDDVRYDLPTLERRSRQNVRRGLENCTVSTVPLERLAEESWDLELQTCERNGRHVALDREAWSRRYLAAAELPGFEGWGALVDGKLGACILGVRVDDWYVLISQQCSAEFVDRRVNNALAFVVTHTVLHRDGVRAVFYALESLDAPATVDEFKFRMGYMAHPVRQRVVFHPMVAELARPFALRIVDRLAHRAPDSRVLSKGAGLLRLHIEGKAHGAERELPECVLPHVVAAQQQAATSVVTVR